MGLLTAAGPMFAGCNGPFVDSRREAGRIGRVGPSTPDHPVICYAPARTSRAEARAMAADVCAQTGRVPRLLGEDDLQCRFTHPRRARFTCVAPGMASPTDGVSSPRGGAIYPGGALPSAPRL